MRIRPFPVGGARPSISLIILVLLLVALWVSGGASRPDEPAQVLARSAAVVAVIAVGLFGAKPDFRTARLPAFVIACAIGLVVFQLIPLPFELWRALPGRQPMASIVAVERPWLPLAIVPSATLNALLSLWVPAAVLAAMAGLPFGERRVLLPVMVALVFCAGLFGLLQLSIGYFDNPLINDTPWQVCGPFANRNHFALFMAFGCLLAPPSVVGRGRDPRRWGPLALLLVIFFLLMILASGSRAGLIVGVLATVFGLAIAGHEVRGQLRHLPRWALPAVAVAAAGLVAALIAITVLAGRATSIDRIFSAETEADVRSRSLPTVLEAVRACFPAGGGMGSFDTLFRMYEPFALLKPTYLNHAHNDFLEIVLDAGLPALLILLAALAWTARASWRAWRSERNEAQLLARLGSVMLFLVLLASVVDYPARTPMIMAVMVIAAVWLSGGDSQVADRSALPRSTKHL